MMLALRNPTDAYDRVSLGARIVGSDPRQLTRLCMDHAIDCLGRALASDAIGATDKRSSSLTGCMNALAALSMGVNTRQQMGSSLIQFYEGLRARIMTCFKDFNRATIDEVQQDLRDVRDVMK